MSSPMSADLFLEALRHEGVTVAEVGDWRNHHRDAQGPWGPVHGIMIHHTATSGTADTVALYRNGRGDLPGPLCHGVIDKRGTVHLVGYGRAHHAGPGDGDVLRAVIAEQPLPAHDPADGTGTDSTDGNRHFYGFECVNLGDGVDPWPGAQLDAVERVGAALCRHHGWTERSVIGHKEWQPGKIDPLGFSMDAMRERIGERIG
ncbi:peptidoglycan recognition family protein [Streptomyces sp. NPDC000594]|uniref:N-acetylmuramoyl-L-alanine amidase n=1 Tax=Streptomyces sp. NPDC000594 TaxID=3154261 RepID=UPI00332C4EDA